MTLNVETNGAFLALKKPVVSERNWLPRRLMRIGEAAKYMAMSPWKLRQLVLDNRLRVVQDVEGGPYLFDIRDLDEYIEKNKRGKLPWAA
jgi:excisionase family DNA binding protein